MIQTKTKLATKKSELATPAGFTLLETLVAISIISVAIAGAFSIAPQGLLAARFAKNQITASYLAQEAIEIVRNHRDNGWAGDPGSGTSVWLSQIPENCIGPGQKCVVNSISNEMSDCDEFTRPPGADCPILRYRDASFGRVYGNGTSFNSADSQESIFTREVEIVRVHNDRSSHPDDTEIAITVTVSWQDSRIPRQVVLRGNLMDWWTRK